MNPGDLVNPASPHRQLRRYLDALALGTEGRTGFDNCWLRGLDDSNKILDDIEALITES